MLYTYDILFALAMILCFMMIFIITALTNRPPLYTIYCILACVLIGVISYNVYINSDLAKKINPILTENLPFIFGHPYSGIIIEYKNGEANDKNEFYFHFEFPDNELPPEVPIMPDLKPRHIKLSKPCDGVFT